MRTVDQERNHLRQIRDDSDKKKLGEVILFVKQKLDEFIPGDFYVV